MARHKQGCSSGRDQALELRVKAAPTGWSSAFAGLSQAAGPLGVGCCLAPEPLCPHLLLSDLCYNITWCLSFPTYNRIFALRYFEGRCHVNLIQEQVLGPFYKLRKDALVKSLL